MVGSSIKYSPEARTELHLATCYFKSIGKKEDFLDDFFKQIDRISIIPTAFQFRYRDVRIALLDHFSYAIHFMIYKDVVYILHIFGQKQDY